MRTDAISIPTWLGMLALLASMPISAVTFTVTRFDDPAPIACAASCSLREAVIAANATAEEDTIVLGAGRYALTQSADGADQLSFDLDVTQPLHILGQGPENTIIRNASHSANEQTRVIEATQVSLTMNDLSLQDGNVYSSMLPIFTPFVRGGCLKVENATIVLSNVTVSNCLFSAIAGYGAGISLTQSLAQLSNVDIHSNSAVYGSGGGLAAWDSVVELNAVSVSDNHAENGGGIMTVAPATINGTALSVFENDALYSGGGIYAYNRSYSTVDAIELNLSADSLIARNQAGENGGGIHVALLVSLRLASVADADAGFDELLRIEENYAHADGGGIHVAPSITNYLSTYPGGSLEAHRLAVRLNTARGQGGGMYSGGSTSIRDSEFAGNAAVADGGGAKISGDVLGNLIERSSFVGNVAGGNGGAIANEAENTELRNLSTYANAANFGGSVYNAGRASTQLTHFTSLDDAAGVGGSLYVAAFGSAEVRNSVLSAGCHRQVTGSHASGQILDGGGNAQKKGQPACAGTAHTQASLGLGYDYFGGRFNVVGFDSGSPLRDKAPLLDEARNDVRGWNRIAPADIGAFEFDATGN
jgi:CSLREA domain-containing protein